ncbi:hypothetical protein ACS0TY_014839 [Phlomoides rotata]
MPCSGDLGYRSHFEMSWSVDALQNPTSTTSQLRVIGVEPTERNTLSSGKPDEILCHLYKPFAKCLLKRYGRCILVDLIVKLQINDRYEFPLELDLDRDNGSICHLMQIECVKPGHTSQGP